MICVISEFFQLFKPCNKVVPCSAAYHFSRKIKAERPEIRNVVRILDVKPTDVNRVLAQMDDARCEMKILILAAATIGCVGHEGNFLSY